MILIIGGGISGLSLAWELQQLQKPYLLLEQAPQTGGYIRSIREGPYLFEEGPNSLLADENLLEWIKGLGLEEELIEANPVSKNRYIYKKGRYRALPSSPQGLIWNSFFSLTAKWSILTEPYKKSHSTEGETLSAFFERRFCHEVVEYALDPFVAGIYAGSPSQLLISQTFPQLLDYEASYGSVLKGLARQGRSRKKTISFKNGLQTLPQAIASKLGHCRTGVRVHSLQKGVRKWAIELQGKVIEADKVVITVDAASAASLLSEAFPETAQALRQVYYPPMAAIYSVYPKKEVSHPLDGFGGLNPAIEGQFALGTIWSSAVFNGRCPQDQVLFTTFVGGSRFNQVTQLPDQYLRLQVAQELTRQYGIASTSPLLQRIYRWPRAIPQYDRHTKDLKRLIDKLKEEHVYCCANWYEGVSLSDCIRKGRELAHRL